MKTAEARNIDQEFSAEGFQRDNERLRRENQIKNDTSALLKMKTLNQWVDEASYMEIPKMLFSEFWHEGEVCILFADTNLGKSVLAVQIGDSITRGVPIPSFKMTAQPQPVLYFDFELSPKQFQSRYSDNFTDNYTWDEKFKRIEINSDSDLMDKFEESLLPAIAELIKETGAKCLIIDNITYLRDEQEKAKNAAPLMKELKALKNKYGLSILIIAHPPKRDLSKPVSRNDLAGSKMLINFCDSAFAIGESHSDSSIRYIKQIKERATEKIYDAGNVCVCQLVKHNNFLQFEFLNFSGEHEHLRMTTENEKEQKIAKAKELHAQGMTQREIGTEIGKSPATVNKYLKHP